MRKKGKTKVTRKLLKQLKPFWRELQKIQDSYNMKIAGLKKAMAKETGIENIEFFFCDNEI
ncbi:MAG: hypothetical protein Q8O02_03415, partial [Candidatus Omnitrophota bacterium]|nr:hypothetical protein [Candidatus Omnitrophota bacterium]